MAHIPIQAPLFIQNDLTVLLDTSHPAFEEVRDSLSRFADLVKSPDRIHTYRLTPYSLWSAAAAGLDSAEIIDTLSRHSRYGFPGPAKAAIQRYMNRYGKLRLETKEDKLMLFIAEPGLQSILLSYPSIKEMMIPVSTEHVEIKEGCRGPLKRELTRLGFPVVDLAGFHPGEALAIQIRNGVGGVRLRSYQEKAVEAFHREGSSHGGSGVIVLPCGAGKTFVGLAAMAKLGCATLILTVNNASVSQWKQEILAKTDLPEDMIGCYSGLRKEVKPVTVATYQILTHRKSKSDPFSHMQIFNERDWGLIIYDEVHLLPAPIFRATAEIQATRRLGLTATLVREDGCEEDVFALVGPKRYDIAWKELEREGWLAKVESAEIRVGLPKDLRREYEEASAKAQFRIAAENPEKLNWIEGLIRKHQEQPTLIIGQYLNQLKAVAEKLRVPLITGDTPHVEREEHYRNFRNGTNRILVVSKVANFAIDLPEASVAIEISGSFGSRQEEAQRLGRVLRPKEGRNEAFFYTLVSKDTNEQEFARKRQLFLIEQGYRYRVVDGEAAVQEELGISGNEAGAYPSAAGEGRILR